MSGQRFGANLEPAAWRLVDADTAAAASVGNAVTAGATVRIATQDAGLWVAFGASGGSATAGTANELLIPAGGVEYVRMPDDGSSTHIHVIQTGASAKWSLSVV